MEGEELMREARRRSINVLRQSVIHMHCNFGVSLRHSFCRTTMQNLSEIPSESCAGTCHPRIKCSFSLRLIPIQSFFRPEEGNIF